MGTSECSIELVLRRHESHIIDDLDGDHISNDPLTESCPEGMKAISENI